MLVYYIQLFRDAYWPDDQLSPASEPPTESQKLEMCMHAKMALLRNIPGLCFILPVFIIIRLHEMQTIVVDDHRRLFITLLCGFPVQTLLNGLRSSLGD